MEALLEVILPVFVVLGLGYVAVWRKLISDDHIDGLMAFTQGFALPCLLFRAMSTLDLAQQFNPWLLLAYYGGAFSGFAAGCFGARYLFGRAWPDCVAIGFCGLFSNTLLLGLPITERAFGSAALAANYAIITVHSPVCYGFGITVMEAVRNRGSGIVRTVLRVLRSMSRNALVIGVCLGLAVNLLGLTIPKVVTDGLDLMVRAALPAALFGLGGILCRYRPEGDVRIVAWLCGVTLLLHPAVVWILGRGVHLPEEAFRSAIVTAACAPGVNAYIFANMYGVAKRVVATTVLVSTMLTILTAWMWLALLGH